MAEIATWMCWGVVIVTWIAGAVYGARTSRGGATAPVAECSGGSDRVVAAVLVYRPPGMT